MLPAFPKTWPSLLGPARKGAAEPQSDVQDPVLVKLDAIEQALLDDLRHAKWQIRHYVDEKLRFASATSLTLPPQSRNRERIYSVIYYVANGPATLQLGGTTGAPTWQVPALSGSVQFLSLGYAGLLLDYDDLRILSTTGAAGEISLRLMGEELMDTGVA